MWWTNIQGLLFICTHLPLTKFFPESSPLMTLFVISPSLPEASLLLVILVTVSTVVSPSPLELLVTVLVTFLTFLTAPVVDILLFYLTPSSNPEPLPTDSDTGLPLYLDSVWRPVSLRAAESLSEARTFSVTEIGPQDTKYDTPWQLSCEDSRKFILTP